MAVMLLIGGIVAAVIAGQFAPYVFLFPWFYRQQRDIIAACSVRIAPNYVISDEQLN